MKITEPIQHDDVKYEVGDEVSNEIAKQLPDGYAVSESEFKKAEKEAEAEATSEDA